MRHMKYTAKMIGRLLSSHPEVLAGRMSENAEVPFEDTFSFDTSIFGTDRESHRKLIRDDMVVILSGGYNPHHISVQSFDVTEL